MRLDRTPYCQNHLLYGAGRRLIMLLLCGSFLAQAHADEAAWSRFMQAGRAAYQRGDYRSAIPSFEAALKEAEGFGAQDPRLAATMNNLALLYGSQGRYAEAEPLYRRSLAIGEKALGPEHPDVATSLSNLALLYEAQGRYAEAEPLVKRSLAIREKALGPEHPNVAQSLSNLALLYEAQGRYAEAEPLVKRSLAIREKALGTEHPDVASSLNNLAELYRTQGRYAEAEPLFRRSLAIREKALGAEHPEVAISINNLALLYWIQGRYAEAEPLYRRALAIREKALGPEHPDVAASLNSLAVLYQAQGRYAEAEPLYRRALAIQEKALDPEHPYVATSLNNLAVLYQAQGRYAEAEPLYRRALAIREKALGPEHPDVAQSFNNLALLYGSQGRYAEAEPLYRRSIAIREKSLGAEHPDVAISLNSLAVLYQAQGRYPEVEPLYRRSLAIQEKALGPQHPEVARSLNNLASLYQAQGRYAEAEPLYRRALAIREKALGPEHPDVAASLNYLAALYRAQKRIGEGLASARRANAILATRYSRRDTADSRGASAEQRTRSWGFEQHVALLQLDGDQNPAARGSDGAEAFAVAQLARASDTAEQVARMAVRFAAGSDALAEVARRRQDLVARAEAVDGLLVREASKPTAQRIAQNEQRLRDEQGLLTKQIAELDGRLDREFPQYRELASPQPLALEAAQKLLGADEVLVFFLVAGDESYVWAVRQGSASFQRLTLTRKDLGEAVKKLRSQLDLGAGDPSVILGRPFDAATAYELYGKLFGPVQGVIEGAKNLLIVPDGALQSLPPGVLVTEPPKGPLNQPADYAQLAWLIKKYAITILPSVGSLRALRAFARTSPGTEPFSGFGNPVLEGNGGTARGVTLSALFSRGPVANVSEVRKLQPLPETADELRAIAATLKAPGGSLYLGSAATETKVKSLDLSRVRNLAFATHGLMAGDFKGMAEPALVLTPPPEGTALDDGLLTASEIAQLKLNAEWVILSACNTAAADGSPGAEGLSGLAKAFFYAGARSLLVSHWAVSSQAATALTTRMFEESAKGASKAQALQRSELALMQRTDNPYFAHPAFWAPFVLVGEGGGDWSKAAYSTTVLSKAAQPSVPAAAPPSTQIAEPSPPEERSEAQDDPVSHAAKGVKRLLEGIFGDRTRPKPD